MEGIDSAVCTPAVSESFVMSHRVAHGFPGVYDLNTFGSCPVPLAMLNQHKPD